MLGQIVTVQLQEGTFPARWSLSLRYPKRPKRRSSFGFRHASVTKHQLHKRATGAWSVRFVGWADWVDCRCFLSFVFLGVARPLELSPCNTKGQPDPSCPARLQVRNWLRMSVFCCWCILHTCPTIHVGLHASFVTLTLRNLLTTILSSLRKAEAQQNKEQRH